MIGDDGSVSMWVLVALGCAAGAVVCGFVGMWVSDQKRRPPVEGWWLGVFFGPLGMILEACLPMGPAERALTAQEVEWKQAAQRSQVPVK